MKGGGRKTSEEMDRERRASKKRNKGGKAVGKKPWQRALQTLQAHQNAIAERKRAHLADDVNYGRIMREGFIQIINPSEKERDDWMRLQSQYPAVIETNIVIRGEDKVDVVLLIGRKRNASEGENSQGNTGWGL